MKLRWARLQDAFIFCMEQDVLLPLELSWKMTSCTMQTGEAR